MKRAQCCCDRGTSRGCNADDGHDKGVEVGTSRSLIRHRFEGDWFTATSVVLERMRSSARAIVRPGCEEQKPKRERVVRVIGLATSSSNVEKGLPCQKLWVVPGACDLRRHAGVEGGRARLCSVMDGECWTEASKSQHSVSDEVKCVHVGWAATTISMAG